MIVNLIANHLPLVTKTSYVVDVKDTVSTDKKDDEVNRNQDARDDRPTVGHNAIVHDVGPLLSCKDLIEVKKKTFQTLTMYTNTF